VAVGSDTETSRCSPRPIPARRRTRSRCTLLLIENAISLFESVYLEELARELVHEFLFIALPIKVQGATGSMLDPVAVV
jgi:kynurenine formamidase